MGDHHHHHDSNMRRVVIALVITGALMVVEVIGGIISSSLALLADAGHMLTDTMALALAAAAFHVSKRPPNAKLTYGYQRFQILAAFVNGLSLLLIVGWILFEAASRFIQPQEVLGGTMLVVAVAGLVVNIICFAVLHGGDRNNLNIRGAALHVAGDLLGSVAAIMAAIMSTVDSLLILASSAVVRDVVQKIFHPNLSDRQFSAIGKALTIVIGLMGLSTALTESRMIFWFVLFAWSGLASAFTPVVLCSLFWARTTKAGAIWVMIAGFLTAVVWVLVFKERFYDLYEMIPGFAAGFIVTIAVSLVTEPPPGAEAELEDVRIAAGGAAST